MLTTLICVIEEVTILQVVVALSVVMEDSVVGNSDAFMKRGNGVAGTLTKCAVWEMSVVQSSSNMGLGKLL